MTPPFPPRFATDGFSDDEVDRFLAGKSTPDELARFRAHLATSPTDATWAAVLTRYELAGDDPFSRILADGSAESRFRAHLSAAVAPPVWHADAAAVSMANMPAANAPVNALVNAPATVPSVTVPPRYMAGRPRGLVPIVRALGWWPMAAVAAVLVAGFFTAGWMTARHTAPSPDVAYTTYSTRSGQIAHVTLGDGTRVTLAPNTTFGVSRDFTTARDVQLLGQAYFDVASAAHAPFLVHTGTVTTRVLGTRFDVRRYADDPVTRVVVVDGKVAVAGRQGVTLAAGGLGRVSDSVATATTVGDARSYAAWTTDGLSFRDVPATELLDVVGHWYGLEFRTTDSALVRQTIVAQLKTGETRAEVFDLIEGLLGATLTFTETRRGTDIVTIAPKRAARQTAPAPRGVRDPLIPQVQEVGR